MNILATLGATLSVKKGIPVLFAKANAYASGESIDGRLGSEFIASNNLRARESTEVIRGARRRVFVAKS